jgi:transposase
MSGFRQPPLPRGQYVLWEHILDEAVPPEHRVRHVVTILRSSAFAPTFQRMEGQYVGVEGAPAYPPFYMAALYVYGQLMGLRSSRKLEDACRNRLDVLWLMEGFTPDHSTVAEFVVRHAEDLRDLLRGVLEIGKRAGLLTAEHTAVDGTKLWANASVDSVRSEERLRQEAAELDGLIRRMEEEYQRNEQGTVGVLWKEPPPEAEGKKLACLRATQERLSQALAEMERRLAKHQGQKPPVRANSRTDPASRVMKDKAGRTRPCYNAQVAVDGKAGLVVAAAVNDQPGDDGQLMRMLKEAQANTGALPAEVSADSQYNTGPDLAAAEKDGIVTYLPEHGRREAGTPAWVQACLAKLRRGEGVTPEEGAQLRQWGGGNWPKELFSYEPTEDVYVCPRGERLRCLKKDKARRSWGTLTLWHYGGAACGRCPWNAHCGGTSKNGRSVTRDQYEAVRERHRARMDTDAGRQAYRQRGILAERPFGHVKGQWGARQFLHRGLRMVGAEFTLMMTAFDLGILLHHWTKVRLVL